MHKTTNNLFLLASTLTLAVGCDAPLADDFAVGSEFRCVGSDCTPPPVGNTSMVGDHMLSNIKEIINGDAANFTADIRVTGGFGLHDEIPRAFTDFLVKEDGQLQLDLGYFGMLTGEAVEGAVFDLLVTPYDPLEAPFTGQLRIEDVECEPGLYISSVSICRYVFVTDVEPKDDELYPETSKGSGWYHVCPDDDDGGLLAANYRFSSVLSPEVTLGYSPAAGPTIDLDSGYFINGCLNGAVSKGQYRLNVFYDASTYRGLKASQRTAMLRMWMAWHDDAPRTEPGNLISPHDPLGGLFTWTSASGWNIEGGYDEDGASCRGGSTTHGKHREVVNPVLNLTGWSSLPHCNTATTLAAKAVLGVKVNN